MINVYELDPVEFERLKNSIANLQDRLGRIQSHLDSEQRVSVSQGKRIDANESRITRVEADVHKHQELLLNKGTGLMFEVDRIKNDKKRGQSNVTVWLSVVSILVSLITALIMLFNR